ncbi:superinfection immunity protein [Sulfurovum sp. TSL1]|uniref:superinfection immunity protein n=1 Tax=Sulfurovum sp. TSL1 TaxID=2826994 RepID=UPI001CC3954F|nr:superinfection immunity protein [Sulfurovum sp. TSL1]GIT98812.1 hypothetical protein TSL1_16330 [Sulfurovum sp. TSL1]
MIMKLFLLLIVLAIYMLPTYLAYRLNHPRKAAITVVNIFGGLFYGIGWVVALTWVFVRDGKLSKLDTE